MSKYDIIWCTKCWMPSTRPNITFDEKGVCHACNWAEEKKEIDWKERQKYFGELAEKYGPRVIVPWSGGKDSIYVAHKMLEFGLEPLLVTVIPHMETEIGEQNRLDTCNDFEKCEIRLPETKYRKLAKEHFIEWGKVKHPWETAISAAVIGKAVELGVPLIVYGEEGGMEYGGTNKAHSLWRSPVSAEYLTETYYHGKLDWDLPPLDSIYFTQWSHYENWSPTKHAEFAKSKGMKVRGRRSIGTFTNDSQLSDKLQDLHQYIIYSKFGFGRASADASIAIRDGTLEREDALELIETLDGEFPNEYLPEYLEYLDMTIEEFAAVIEHQRNKDLTEMIGYNTYLQKWVAKKRRRGTIVADICRDRFNYERK